MTPDTTKNHDEALQSFFSCLDTTLISLQTSDIMVVGKMAESVTDPDFIATPAYLNFDGVLMNQETKKKLWIKLAAQRGASIGNAMERIYKYLPWYHYMAEYCGGKFSLVTLYQDDEAEASINHARMLATLGEMDRTMGTSFTSDALILYSSNKAADLLEYCVSVHEYLGVPHRMPTEAVIW